MSDEELNKKMEFIVEQQAKFASDIEMMREVHKADSKLVKNGLIGLVDIVGQLAHSQMKLEDTVNLLAENFRQLTEVQSRTEERLTILINVVERKLGGNGPEMSTA